MNHIISKLVCLLYSNKNLHVIFTRHWFSSGFKDFTGFFRGFLVENGIMRVVYIINWSVANYQAILKSHPLTFFKICFEFNQLCGLQIFLEFCFEFNTRKKCGMPIILPYLQMEQILCCRNDKPCSYELHFLPILLKVLFFRFLFKNFFLFIFFFGVLSFISFVLNSKSFYRFFYQLYRRQMLCDFFLTYSNYENIKTMSVKTCF